MEIFFREVNETVLSYGLSVIIPNAGTYNELHTKVRTVKRTENCGIENDYHAFSDRYTQETCMNACFLKHFYNKCGHAWHYRFQDSIPKEWKEKRPPSFNKTANKICKKKYEAVLLPRNLEKYSRRK